MKIEEGLKNLGLAEKEAKVYIALVQLGRGSAQSVADESGIKRPTAYVILENLIDKGMAVKIPRARKKLYEAKPPDEFFAEAEERFALSKTILPELMAMADKTGPKFKTLYYEGEQNVKRMLSGINKKMAGKEILGFYARETENISSEMNEFFHQWNEDCKKNGITVRGLTPDDPSLEWYRKRTEYFGHVFKYLNMKDYSSECSIEIGDDFIQIFSLRYMQGVYMENPDVARTLRQIFEMVWAARPEKIEGALSEDK
ncbi:MAG: hypothetical protein A3H69_01505 [Candidatus Sungbacteria bacterium RIFCSPLOWO2_02_FULL_47_9]|nr:MAG: Transcriptional regulator, TrmB [Parcubacteria group bacterium GW2011_GWA2_47_10]OGZ99540.1 MAG: hypothetical protein A3D57_00330 [Candidatus Sungbacteria bacterium RIFCSPHIGHO2_02_FULL_46_12]OHA05209.1 MAG: hypothetical protein A3A28_01975 [Candidatus Sungbacteria bacterium RIFCSPLOWO2_01_FULL_47_32]OHA11818.1 MAG: hypothetical protein A3H69_01505 [Candidatus Sungbacteria bacterium RIFCSPLOWO2_02_FULL_47_9]